MTPRLDYKQSVLLRNVFDARKNLVGYLKLPANETFVFADNILCCKQLAFYTNLYKCYCWVRGGVGVQLPRY